MRYNPLTKETLYCPVCKQKLGVRPKGRTADAKCDECQHIFTYKKSNKIPVASRKPDKRCNCVNCRS